MEHLIDTNVISGYFSGVYSESAMEYLTEIIDDIPNISVITQIEALSWINADKSKERILKSFVEDSNILPLTESVVKECVKLRRNRKIKTPDAIIASTAIANHLTLISEDGGFENIPNLKVINPFQI